MRTIQIDDAVYSYLQTKARAFEETPNDVLHRLLGVPQETVPISTRKIVNRETKGPKTDLVELIKVGKVRNGEKVAFINHDGRVGKNYEAQISENGLLYKGKWYSMSGLVAKILEEERCGIPSKAYRGPFYWRTQNGKSIHRLWEEHLRSNHS